MWAHRVSSLGRSHSGDLGLVGLGEMKHVAKFGRAWVTKGESTAQEEEADMSRTQLLLGCTAALGKALFSTSS